MNKNPFAALDEPSEGSSKTVKVEKKVEAPKPQPKVQEKPKTVEKPKTDKPVSDKPKPKSESTQDGFEQVGKSQRGGRARGSDRGARGGSRGTSTRGGRGGRGGSTTRPPRVDSNASVETGVTGKDVRVDTEKTQIEKKSEFRDQRTGKPRSGNAKGTGRFHDHHLSGTGTRGGFKKRGGGGHNWGSKTDQIEAETEAPVDKEEETTESTEEKKEEAPVDPKTLSEEQKKQLRKKRKEQEKAARKGKGKKEVEKKSDELSVDQVKVTKVDPSQKTFEQYQKELEEKKKATQQGVAKVLPNAPKVEEKKAEKKDDKKDEKKAAIDVNELFKPTQAKKKTFDGPKKDKKAPPKVTDSKDFPSLK